MEKSEFTPFSELKPKENKHIVVTNNIDAVNAHGEMSHVWMTSHAFKGSNKNDGIITFDAADRQIYNLTHWKYV